MWHVEVYLGKHSGGEEPRLHRERWVGPIKRKLLDLVK